MRPLFIISNYAKLLQNMPGLCKFCITFKKIALKCANNFEKKYAKLCTMRKTAGTG